MPTHKTPQRVPTTRCPRCGTEYAAACPACPYCDWVPLRPGRAKWQRRTFIAVGIIMSAGLALLVRIVEAAMRLDATMAGWAFAGGAFLTVLLANRYIGGGKDL